MLSTPACLGPRVAQLRRPTQAPSSTRATCSPQLWRNVQFHQVHLPPLSRAGHDGAHLEAAGPNPRSASTQQQREAERFRKRAAVCSKTGSGGAKGTRGRGDRHPRLRNVTDDRGATAGGHTPNEPRHKGRGADEWRGRAYVRRAKASTVSGSTQRPRRLRRAAQERGWVQGQNTPARRGRGGKPHAHPLRASTKRRPGRCWTSPP